MKALNLKMKKEIILKVNSLCFLRVLNEGDVSKDYISWLNDYEVSKYTQQRFIEHNFKRVKDFVMQKLRSSVDILFGIFYNNTHIGNIKLGPIRWEHKSAEISYFIGDKNFWRKGIASNVVKRVVEYAVNDLFLEKINSAYIEPNRGSAKVLKKCGFLVEGERVSEMMFENERTNLILVGLVVKHITN